jgi:predicted transcriptional regulator
MKRLQMLIDRDLDDALERLARAHRTSKAALIRKYVRERLEAQPPLEADPIFRMAGADSFAPAPIDDVVYR